MTRLEDMSPGIVGERLRIAREAANLTQADAANALEIARTTLVAIEKGQRKVRLSELRKLALLYRTTVNGLLREEAVHVELAPRFRKLPLSGDDSALAAAHLLGDLAKAEVELENVLGIKRSRSFPPERPLLPGDVRLQAENDAMELRQRLGLGQAPIQDIVSLLEFELGVRVYVRKDVDPKISGLFVFDERLGPCILLNANHPRTRRTHTAAHECGHFISTRREAEILDVDETDNSREERYANAFARAFLTPARALTQKFQEVTAGSNRLTRRHVIVLASYFGVSLEAMLRRLEELRLTKPGTWDWFVGNGGITEEHVQQVLGDAALLRERDPSLASSLRLNMMAAEAHRQDLLSEGQLSSLLRIDRVTLREIIGNLEHEGSEADDAPFLPA